MSTIQLQQVKCPNCGAPITAFNEFKPNVECPYCHQVLHNPNATAVRKDMPQPDRMITFKTKEEDFGEHLVTALIKRNYIPQDIFDHLSAGDVIKAYLPMFLYEGKYQATWNGEVEEEYESNGERKTRYSHVNGNAFGNFSVMCLAYQGNDIPAELQEFSHTFPYNVNDTQQYDPQELGDDVITLTMNADSDLVWERNGRELVEKQSEREAQRQAGYNVRNFQSSCSYDLLSKGRLVMVPFWFVYYTYMEEKYYFLMDGLGQHEQLTAPVDKEEKKRVNQFNWLFWVTGAILLLGILFNFMDSMKSTATATMTIGGIALAATAIFYFLRRKSILSASEEMRKQGAARFLASQG